MPKTFFGRILESAKGSEGFRTFGADLNKISKVKAVALHAVIKKAACSASSRLTEIAQQEAAQHPDVDKTMLFDAAASVFYVWENGISHGDSIADVVDDLKELVELEDVNGKALASALELAKPLTDLKKIVALYKTFGPPALTNIRGTIDLRCRFHKTVEDQRQGGDPLPVPDLIPVIIGELRLDEPIEGEQRIAFQMDEAVLALMENFVKLMARELARAKEIAESKK